MRVGNWERETVRGETEPCRCPALQPPGHPCRLPTDADALHALGRRREAPIVNSRRSGYPISSGRVIRVLKKSGNENCYPITALEKRYLQIIRVPAISVSGSGILDLPKIYKITVYTQTTQIFA